MSYALDILYLLILCLVSPWLLYSAWRTGKYRDGLASKCLGRVPWRTGSAPCLWAHAVSVGEVHALATLLHTLRKARPDLQLYVSTTTRTGYAVAQQKFRRDTVCYAPLDFSWAVGTALRRIRPDTLLLVELELWPNLIAAAKRRGVPVAIVNGRLSEQSFRGYRRARSLVRRWLNRVDLLAVQTETYGERFADLGAIRERIVVTGSIKFDGAERGRDNPRTASLAALAGIEAGDDVLVAGSTQAPEEALVINAYRELVNVFPGLRLLIVPRHPERFTEVARLLEQAGLPWQRRSELPSPAAAVLPSADRRILLVDTVGELAAWWGCASIAFVGGSLGSRGGQNMIEPAGYGAAVCFGPRTHNFRDVTEMLLAARAAVVVHDGVELTAFIRRCLEKPAWAGELGQRAATVVARQRGAAQRTVLALSEILPLPRPDMDTSAARAVRPAATRVDRATTSESIVGRTANPIRGRS